MFFKVIQGIQSGPYKNIYNPENCFISKDGSGAANNWGSGYSTGDSVQEEIFDIIDREVDGSDSLEVRETKFMGLYLLIDSGFHVASFYCWWYWLWSWELSA